MQIRLSENIRALRRRHGLTQEQLAEALGMTPGAVYKWEAGLSQPELAVIVELADLFQDPWTCSLDMSFETTTEKASLND